MRKDSADTPTARTEIPSSQNSRIMGGAGCSQNLMITITITSQQSELWVGLITLALTECIIINPRRACASRVTVVVSVCLCVYDYSRSTGCEAAYELYQQLQCYKGKKSNVAILLKPPRSRDMA